MNTYEKLSVETIRLLREGLERGLTFEVMTSRPDALEQTLGRAVPEDSIAQIRALSSSELRDRVAGLSPEAINCLHQIVIDGRFVQSWKDDIPTTLDALSLPLTPEVQRELQAFDLNDLISYEPKYLAYIGTISIAVAVVVGVAVANDRLASTPMVVDLSGIPKF